MMSDRTVWRIILVGIILVILISLIERVMRFFQ